ncbi:N-acetylglucosamine-1-phosphate uridyltransferase [Cutibacterium acnes JCM 18916]|nr:N-acetylglucosamine-1-phosphate uridyltransferase [Cutibacterium acnes JCM 18916]
MAAVIVLAAGGGTRMKSTKSKLLHEVAGRPMLSWAIGAARGLNPEHLVVVVGHRREQVEAHLAEDAPDVTTAVQAEQKKALGTPSHAGSRDWTSFTVRSSSPTATSLCLPVRPFSGWLRCTASAAILLPFLRPR